VSLRHGKASLRTSSLQLGPNTIQADYTPSQGFDPSTAAVIENVRAHRSKSKAASSPEAAPSRQFVPSTAIERRVGGAVASPAEAVTLLAAPTVLGPIALDQRRLTPGADLRGGTRPVR
jgi:hypothetical protein